jgi:hypothetical protein
MAEAMTAGRTIRLQRVNLPAASPCVNPDSAIPRAATRGARCRRRAAPLDVPRRPARTDAAGAIGRGSRCRAGGERRQDHARRARRGAPPRAARCGRRAAAPRRAPAASCPGQRDRRGGLGSRIKHYRSQSGSPARRSVIHGRTLVRVPALTGRPRRSPDGAMWPAWPQSEAVPRSAPDRTPRNWITQSAHGQSCRDFIGS